MEFAKQQEWARVEIERIAERTHPDRGTHSRCATGEPYVTYGLACKSPEEAAEALINTFRILRRSNAVQVPEGAVLSFMEPSKRQFLYWRRYPEIQPIELNPEDAKRHPGPWYSATCRAVLSEMWTDGSQSMDRVEGLISTTASEAVTLTRSEGAFVVKTDSPAGARRMFTNELLVSRPDGKDKISVGKLNREWIHARLDQWLDTVGAE